MNGATSNRIRPKLIKLTRMKMLAIKRKWTSTQSPQGYTEITIKHRDYMGTTKSDNSDCRETSTTTLYVIGGLSTIVVKGAPLFLSPCTLSEWLWNLSIKDQLVDFYFDENTKSKFLDRNSEVDYCLDDFCLDSYVDGHVISAFDEPPKFNHTQNSLFIANFQVYPMSSTFDVKTVTNVSHAVGLECFLGHGLMLVLVHLGEQ